MVPTLAAILLAAAAATPLATEVAGPTWDLNLSALTGSPVVLPRGLALGAAAEVRRYFPSLPAPLFASARFGWTLASGGNDAWLITHHQPVLSLGVGLTTTLGAGRLWGQAGGGVGGVYEVLSRHQQVRIEAAGVPGATESSFTLGPQGFAELGVAVQLRGAVSGFLAAGPWLFSTVVSGTSHVSGGGFARLGVSYDL